MKKKVFTVILATILTLMFSATALARWSYITGTICGLSIDNGGLASAVGDLEALRSPVNKTKVVVTLQQYKSSKWNNLKVWQDTWNEQYVQAGGTWYVEKGYSYRIYVQYYAYNGSTQLEYFDEYYNYDFY